MEVEKEVLNVAIDIVDDTLKHISEKIFDPIVKHYQLAAGSIMRKRPFGRVAAILGYSRQYYNKHCSVQQQKLLLA